MAQINIVERIIDLFAGPGQAAYYGEAVSQTEHALQSARLAVQAKADDALIVAALLHDVGHMLRGSDEHIAERGIDDVHEELGAAWLERHFLPEVTGPVRLHVAAKRYLCAVDRAYHDSLSPASQRSLRLQGGPFSAAELAAFEAKPFFAGAVALRRFDDAAKIPGLDVPGLEQYRAALECLFVGPDIPVWPGQTDK